MKLQLVKILSLTLGHDPSTNSYSYAWLFPTALKNYNKKQDCFKVDLKF